jgi:BlaI family transcriptional regulator, penicillinase repressor
MSEKINRREREILDIIYQEGEASAQEVMAGLGDGTSNSAVRTILTILENKGYLQHRQEGKRYVYSPTVAAQQAGCEALKRAVSTYFRNSAEQAIAALIESERDSLGEKELLELKALIEKARGEGR